MQDDRSITFIQDDDGNRSLTVIATDGEVVFEHQGHVTDEPPFEFGEEALSIVDDDGETIVTIPSTEVMDREVWQVESRAWEEYHEQNPYTPDFLAGPPATAERGPRCSCLPPVMRVVRQSGHEWRSRAVL